MESIIGIILNKAARERVGRRLLRRTHATKHEFEVNRRVLRAGEWNVAGKSDLWVRARPTRRESEGTRKREKFPVFSKALAATIGQCE